MAVHVHNVLPRGDDDGENPMEKMSEMFGPGHVDQTVRQAIQACWMALPKDRRTVDEVEKQIHKIVERALANFRDDAGIFGRPA